ncbi:hypothetical protein ACH4VT_15355 [Streptomyces lydicus]|uniref:hypothetical protein n=1 Tax=Streptomyces lydicus TaxID=47763 RepID=UPI0037B9B032
MITRPVITGPVVTGPVVTGPVITRAVITRPVITRPVVTRPVITRAGLSRVPAAVLTRHAPVARNVLAGVSYNAPHQGVRHAYRDESSV